MQKLCPVCGKENEAFEQYCVGCDARLEVATIYKSSNINADQNDTSPIIVETDDASGDGEYVITENELDLELQTSLEELNVSLATTEHSPVEEEKHDSEVLNNIKLKTAESRHSMASGTREQSKHETLEHSTEKSEKGFIQFNYLVCPYCGELNKQSEFFCQTCYCDLKTVKIISVSKGKLDEYKNRYKTRAMDYLVGNDYHNVDGQFKRFMTLVSNKSLDVRGWDPGRDMRLEASGSVVPKAAHVLVALVISLIARRMDVPMASLSLVIIPVALGFIQKKVYLAGEDEVVIFTEKGIDIIREVGNNMEKARDIEWDQIQQIAIIGKGREQRLRLESADLEHTCLIPRFAPKKRAMMLNIFGIIANRNQYKVYYDKNAATTSLEASV